ncbi:MAG: T9SS type A sorting domain-containing protein [Bacteroidia bacterium]|nr:T9SS type A sorting domain-containing protein [Bacteroidia bacterium]MCZ2276327.1 T9SS type A sorting domain-containing protein [Bacteroidia bacterium]
MKKYLFILLFTFCSNNFALSQYKNSIWVFGDSSLIDFSDTSNILTGYSAINSRGSCSSICDTNGTLLFYTGYDDDVYSIGGPPFNGGEIWNNQHQTMQYGDSLVMGLWYHEVVIIPDPGNSNRFYVFCIGVTGNFGLYYSVVDITANGGLGAVIQKNIPLQSFEMSDCLTAVRHGNGRDWWIVFREYYPSTNAYTSNFYTYLITPAGIINFTLQSVGTPHRTGLTKIEFNPEGNEFITVDAEGLIELYDFDRCTGVISNPVTIELNSTAPPYPYYDGSAFSPNGQILYVSAEPFESYLFQYDLNAPNIGASKDTLWTTTFPLYTAGFLKLAPDSKIYFSCQYYNGFQFPYPYPDTVYNMYNMNLSVINSPDSLGVACDFQPFSFYLGGKRTYYGLPNNPDYEMGAWVGSPCDTLTGISNIEQGITNAEMFVFYHPGWQTAFINAQNVKGKNCLLQIFNMTGKVIFSATKSIQPPYFTMDINCEAFAKGMYVVNLKTEKETLTKNFIKY